MTREEALAQMAMRKYVPRTGDLCFAGQVAL